MKNTIVYIFTPMIIIAIFLYFNKSNIYYVIKLYKFIVVYN